MRHSLPNHVCRTVSPLVPLSQTPSRLTGNATLSPVMSRLSLTSSNATTVRLDRNASSASSASSGSSSASAASSALSGPRLTLVATTPSSVGIPQLIPLRAGETLLFGRSKDADVYLDSTLVANMISRTHAKIVCSAPDASKRCKVTLFDLHSTNGVYVNDRKTDVAQLEQGDRITFGGRGKMIKIGTVDPQPASEFIYEFSDPSAAAAAESEDAEEEEEEGTMEILKDVTDHVQLIITWVTAAIGLGVYLFAEEGSEEFSFARDYAAPIFALVGLPFNRATFVVSFVGSVGVLLAAALAIVKAQKKGGKKGGGKKKL